MPDLKQILDKQPKRIDISEDMTDSFYRNPNIHKGMVLGLRKDGEEVKHYKIVRLNRGMRKCEVVETQLYKEDEVDIVDKEQNNETQQ